MSDAQKIIKYFATLFAFILIGFIFYIPILVSVEFYKTITDEIKKDDNLSNDVIKKDISTLEFSKMIIDINTCNININTGDEFKLESNDNKLAINIKDTNLNIESNNKNIFNKNKCKLNINIPEEVINTITIKNKYGDIKINNIVINDLNINNNVGDININKSKISNTLINNSIGDINIDANINDKLDISSTIGDVTLMINDKIDNYKSNITKKIGSISIDGVNYSNDIILGNGDKKIDINSIIGGVSVNFQK